MTYFIIGILIGGVSFCLGWWYRSILDSRLYDKEWNDFLDKHKDKIRKPLENPCFVCGHNLYTPHKCDHCGFDSGLD